MSDDERRGEIQSRKKEEEIDDPNDVKKLKEEERNKWIKKIKERLEPKDDIYDRKNEGDAIQWTKKEHKPK